MKKILLLFLSLSIVSFTVYITGGFTELLENKIANYEANAYPEKVYVQTDKPFYSTDEDLWFSAYLVNGITHQRTNKSRVLHVELINPSDSIVAKKELYVDDISVAGDFRIQENWVAGNYKLRAYTQYMRNNGPEDFFSKEIPVYYVEQDSAKVVPTDNSAAVVSTQESTKKPNSKPTLSFYPEGGYMIEDIPNKITFKIKDKNYSQVNVKGVIKDQNGNEVIEFNTVDLGLGSFVLIPETGKTYNACIYVNDKEIKYPLPTSLAKGHSLNVTNTGSHIYANIQSTHQNGLQNTYLVVHQRGHLLYKKFEETTKNNYTIQIGTKELKDGVTEITLFDANGNPVAERLVFIDNPQNNLKLNIETPTKTFGIRKQVDVALDLKNIQEEYQSSSLSLAVRNLEAFPYNSRTNNIKTYLLLNSDLRGKIENPGYFFEKENNAKRRYLLDLVMMTNGWRRFKWAEFINNEPENKFEPEIGLFISGTTQLLKKPHTVHSAPVRLTFAGKQLHQEPIQQSDSLGKFKFGPYVFFDSITSILEARKDKFKSTKRKSRDIVILVDNSSDSPDIIPSTTQKQSTFVDNKEVTNFKKVTQYVKEIKFKYDQQILKLEAVQLSAERQTKEEEREEEMSEMTDYGEPMMGQRKDMTKEIGIESYTAFDMVRRMTGVRAFGDSIQLSRTGRSPAIYLDGMEIESDFLRYVRADEISFIDLLLGATDTATFINGGNGVIALYSRTGVKIDFTERKPGIINFNTRGYYTAREFYSPNHLDVFDNTSKSDVRTTLYWKPDIKTTTKGSYDVSFFTNDIATDYIIEVEGISTDGQPIHGTKIFTVE